MRYFYMTFRLQNLLLKQIIRLENNVSKLTFHSEITSIDNNNA